MAELRELLVSLGTVLAWCWRGFRGPIFRHGTNKNNGIKLRNKPKYEAKTSTSSQSDFIALEGRRIVGISMLAENLRILHRIQIIVISSTYYTNEERFGLASVIQTSTLRKLHFHYLSHWMGYDRGDSFPFDFEPNGNQLGPIQCERKWKHSFLSV